MAITIIQSATDIIQRIRTDIQRNLPGSNPFFKNGFLSAISIAFGNRFYDLYRLVNYWNNQHYVQTADNDNIGMFAELKDVSQGVASPSQGPLFISGTVGKIVDAGSIYTFAGLEYSTDAAAEINEITLNVINLVQVGGTATASFATAHNLASNTVVTIAGADQPGYNLTATILVTEADKFTYSVDPATPGSATGTITATTDGVSVGITCTQSGDDTNADGGSEFSAQVTDPDLNTLAYAGFGGIQGGTDDQSTEEYREEVIDAWQNPTTNFNEEAIKRQCRSVNGVTRVFVFRITPALGQVTVYFTRDNDTDLIPSASEVATVKEQVNAITPADISFDDVFVEAPTAVPSNFGISNIVPDSNSMRNAISNSLDSFFRTVPEVGVNVTENEYTAAISNTFDLDTGEKLQSYTLDLTGDIVITTGELATLGIINYS